MRRILCLLTLLLITSLALSKGEGFLKNIFKVDEFNLETLSDPIFEHIFADTPDYKCNIRKNIDSTNFYYFMPAMRGILHNQNQNITFEGTCFQKIYITYNYFSNSNQLEVNINTSSKKSFLCKESLFIGTSNLHSIKILFLTGNQTVRFNVQQNDLDEIRVNGIRVFSFCQGFWTSFRSFLKTLTLFLGGLSTNPNLPVIGSHVPKYMEEANIKFLEEFINFPQVPRTFKGKVLPLNKTEIKTGDYLAIHRYDGLDPLIMFGTGSHTGHSAVAAWIDNELYVLESQDGWYWPKHGIQRNKWEDWIQNALNADFSVAVLPLSEESRSKLNVTRAIEWFHSLEGLEYGYRNFLFSWIDTKDKNFPEILDYQLFLPLFGLVNKLIPSAINMIVGEALNMRLNTTNLTLPQAVAESARRNISFEELLAIVEKEGWEYSTGKNYVCSCFVVGFWKAAGLFGDLEIEATEFSPKDVYQLKVFNTTYNLPEVCREADPDLPYCQVLGNYKLTLTNYNRFEPYNHMNERCSSQAPRFEREENC
jgi:hypothetical protein